MKKTLLLVCLAISLSSCKLYTRFFNGEVIARVGREELYRSDISKLNISGLSPEDSARAVMQYIYSWAKDRLLIDMAEAKLSKADKDVEDQLEDYRRQLLIFRYEQEYVKQRLDTTVSESEYKAYYDKFPDNFITPVPLLKGMLIKIVNNSPSISIVRSLYRSRKPEDLERLDEVCYSSADKYVIYDEWTSMEILANEIDIELAECQSVFSKVDYMERRNSGYTYFMVLDDIIASGSVAPYEYSKGKIRDILLSRRKQDLIMSLERNLLNDAIVSDRLIIYNEKNN